MKDSHFTDLIDSGRLDELEAYWLEQMESGTYEFEDFLEAARLIGRHREKVRAGVLMTFLQDHLKEKQRWPERLRVLKEIVRHTADQKKLEDIRDQLRETLKLVYPSRPSFTTLVRHFQFEEQRSPEDLANAVDRLENWLKHDVGQLFYQQGYGAGRVTEINPKLGVMRIDFEKRKDVTVEPGDAELILLKEGHILYEKMQFPEQFRSKAEGSPSEALGRLLQDFGRPMAVGEIKDCFAGGISDWTRWWTAAKKHPQVVASGKGAQAEYSWSQSASAAEESLRKEFDAANVHSRMALARQHAARGGQFAQHFLTNLLQDAKAARERREFNVALEMLDLFAKWPGGAPDPGYTFEQVLKESEPRALLQSLDNLNLKTRVLNAYPQVLPDSWKAIYTDWFTREENPKLLTYIFQQLQEHDLESAEILLNRVFGSLYAFPPALVWVCECGAAEGLDTDADLIGQRLEGKFLLGVIEAIDSNEFSHYRNRIKKALEGGLLMNILNEALDPDVATKAIEMLNHTRHLEDYRRDRWRNFIRSRIPETKKKDDVIFSTKEASERKRVELEHLIKVELPVNRKAIGEAAAHGDLRENHEYKAARERQEYLINRVQQLQDELTKVRVLEPGATDCSEVRPGTRVLLVQPSKSLTLTLLGPWDSNPKEGVYSYQAPIGELLLGKAPGDIILWNDESWTVEKIEPWS